MNNNSQNPVYAEDINTDRHCKQDHSKPLRIMPMPSFGDFNFGIRM
jgi:hypothetical protein